jgi:effector-binding domain-containing protein
MNLVQKSETVTWPETHYVYIEKIGPFQQTAPAAWQQVHPLVPAISEHNPITGFMTLYKIEPNRMTYRAGVAVAAAPTNLPDGFQHTRFGGGKYVCFVLTGSYSNLPQASGRVFEIISEKQIPRRDDFCIENYVTDPRTTPEEQLITEILVPTL